MVYLTNVTQIEIEIDYYLNKRTIANENENENE
jgi:hypothetical protein